MAGPADGSALGGFAGRIRFRDSKEDRAVIAEFAERFKRETGWDYPTTDLEWRDIFAAAGFTLEQEYEIRTKLADESEIAS